MYFQEDFGHFSVIQRKLELIEKQSIHRKTFILKLKLLR
jgi:hypothetical protein